jgi:UDP-N-acetylglucosamine acyltransferase
MRRIDERACVDASALLGEDVEVGPFSVIGPLVRLANGVRVGPQCVIDGDVEIGEGSVLTSHVAIGSPPQDLKYGGESTRVVIGARNAFREFCTVNRGTAAGGGITSIGDDNLFMTGAHVAHDCRVGSRTVFANNATLGGHVSVGDCTTIGAFTAAHQFCRIGRHAFIGGFTVVTKDVLPFMKTVGSRGDVTCYGPNRIGLQRKGMPTEVVEALARAFRILRAPSGRTPDGFARILEEQGSAAEVRELVEFAEAARAGRGFHL